MTKYLLASVPAALVMLAPPALAQRTLDRVSPGAIENKEASPDKSVDRPTPTTIAPQTSAIESGSEPITVGAITLIGLQVLKPSAFADIFETYVGRTLSPGALAGLVDALVERARSRGYPFASAWIEPQTLSAGLLRVRIDEGSIDEIRLTGNDNAAVRTALAPLVGRGPVTLSSLERRLLLAGDIDGLWLKRTRFVREGGRGVLLVDVGRDRTKLQVTLANDGTKPIGPVQLQLDGAVSQLFAPDDNLIATFITTPLQPEEFAYGRLRYAKRVSTNGAELSLAGSYSTSHPGSYLKGRDISGESWVADGRPAPTVATHAQDKHVGSGVVFPSVRSRNRGATCWRVAIAFQSRGRAFMGFSQAAGGKLRISATLSQGLDILGATQQGDALASRRDADGTFTALSLFAGWTSPIAGPASVYLGASGQLASRPLLVSEEIGLGGGSFIRAYDYSERTGDQGYMDRRTPLRARRKDRLHSNSSALYVRRWWGVTNLDNGFGGGSLFSSGGGVRASLTRTLQAGAEIAVPLSGVRYDSGNADPVFNFRLTKAF